MPLEDRRDLGAIGGRDPGRRPELFIELVTPARGVDDDQLGRPVGQVEERMRQAGREVRESARLEDVDLIADPDLELAGQDMDRLFLSVVDVQRRTPAGPDLDDEVVKRPGRVLAGDLEDQVAPGPGLQPQPLSATPGPALYPRLRSSCPPPVVADRVFALCKQYEEYLRVSNNSGADAARPRRPPEPDPFTADEFGAWRGMLRVHSAVFRELDDRPRAEHGFGVDAYGVLITLVSSPARQLPIGALGERRNLSPSGISRSVDRLVRAGLLTRSTNPEDGRSLLVALTPDGLRRLREAQVTHHRVVRETLLGRLEAAGSEAHR